MSTIPKLNSWRESGGHLHNKIKMAKSSATDYRFLREATYPSRCLYIRGTSAFPDRCSSVLFGEYEQELAVGCPAAYIDSAPVESHGWTGSALAQPGG